MKISKLMTLAVLTSTVLMTTGCLRAPFQPPEGVAYTNYKAPLGTDLADTKIGPRTGRSTATSILGLFAFGDASIQTAAKNAGIRKAYHTDYEYFNILGIVQETTVIVNGE
jgi:hypothetical protein